MAVNSTQVRGPLDHSVDEPARLVRSKTVGSELGQGQASDGVQRLGEVRPPKPRVVGFGKLEEFLAGVGLATQRGIDVDVIAGLTTRVQGAHLVGHSVVTRQHRADVQDSRWILPPVDSELDLRVPAR
jgi:hypothetical protein